MKLLSARNYVSKLKATIHQSGKLGFSEPTARELGFMNDVDHFVQFAQDDEDPDLLYLLNNTKDDGDSFRVNKAGSYYYVSAKLLFDGLGLDYVHKTIIFDMMKTRIDGMEVYKMTKRELIRQDKTEK